MVEERYKQMTEKTKGFEVQVPDPQPTVHTREFSKEEVEEALKEFLILRGIEFPKGDNYLIVLDDHRHPNNWKIRMRVEVH